MAETEYIAAGYFLSRLVGPDCTGTPMRQVTLARDHSLRRFFPNSWTLSWVGEARDDRVAAASEFGILEQDLDQVIAWADRGFGTIYGAWSTFFTLEAARAAAHTMLAGARDLELWGVGLHRDLLAGYCRASVPPPPEPGFAPTGASGAHIAACTRTAPLTPGGRLLGFEVLFEACSAFDSAESLHLDESAALRAARVTPNGVGLLDSLADALLVCQHLPPPPAEDPTPRAGWLPWRIVEYPLSDP